MMIGFYAGAQCPAGQTEITLEIVTVGFGAEVGWELVDATTGTVIACQPSGTYASNTTTLEGPYCVMDGNTLVFTGYDSFGDDWNGGFFNVIVTEDGSVNGCGTQDGCVVLENAGENIDVEPDVDVASSCDGAEAEEFVINLPVFGCNATPFMGCTTMGDPNFEPCATIDDGSCICSDTQTDLANGNTFCTNDAATPVTAVIPDSPVTAILTAEGTFDGEIGVGLYSGTFDDGSVIGLPPAGTGLFGTDTETSLEGSTPGANNVNTAGNFGGTAVIGNSITSGALMNGGTYTLFVIDDFGDGWNGNDADLVDCEGNVILANLAQYIDAIAANAQDEVAFVTFTYNAPPATIVWSGAGAVTTDPDGTSNSGDEIFTFDPAMAGVMGCDPTDINLTMNVTSCGETCETVVTVSVYPPAQTPTIIQDDDVCNYTILPACPGDILDVTSTTAAPAEDPAPLDVMVTTADGCVATLQVDPVACAALPPPIAALNCPAEIDLCTGGTVSINASDDNPNSAPTSTPTYGGTAAGFINTAGTTVASDDVIDVSLVTAPGTYTLSLQLTATNGDVSNIAECIINVVINCDAEGGSFPSSGP